MGVDGGLIVEEATAEDAEEILALQRAAYASEGRLYNDPAIPPLTQTLEELREDFSRQLFLKAVEEGEIVGSVRARMKEGSCLIGRLIVRPDRQGRGIGSRLMKEIEARFPLAESYRLFTGHLSEKALHIYGRLGYETVRTEPLREHLTLVYLERKNRRDAD